MRGRDRAILWGNMLLTRSAGEKLESLADPRPRILRVCLLMRAEQHELNIVGDWPKHLLPDRWYAERESNI